VITKCTAIPCGLYKACLPSFFLEKIFCKYLFYLTKQWLPSRYIYGKTRGSRVPANSNTHIFLCSGKFLIIKALPRIPNKIKFYHFLLQITTGKMGTELGTEIFRRDKGLYRKEIAHKHR